MTLHERRELVEGYLGKAVKIVIDRPIGYIHTKGEKTLVYPINYGYIPGVLGGDGEELDVYLLGVEHAVKEYTGRIIGIVFRENDAEDKLIMAPENLLFTSGAIADMIEFQEKYYKTRVVSIA